ncbi:MAG: crotonase/enoyl-CoA hydratase family protein [Granulosicoccus sp.]|nr:crotonase/enoyl-CoA hydratase family protein [Granulosicoccus sp.]
MKLECFEVDILGHVAHVRLSRPEKRNSMVATFWDELPALVDGLDSDGKTRAIVISSTGPHFSSGMDVSVFTNGSTTQDPFASRQRAARFRGLVQRLQSSFSSLEQARVPVLAAIQGGCIGAGVDLVTACDMRYATADSYFTIYETNLAMTADVGTFPRICKLMPDGLVRELAYTGRALSANEARECGLVNKVYATHEEMVHAVLAIAQTIAEKAPLAVHGCKRMILHARDHTVADSLDYVALWNASFFQREDTVEAMNAAREKRAGDFTSLPEMPSGDQKFEIP